MTVLEEFITTAVDSGVVPGAVGVVGIGDHQEVVARGVASPAGEALAADAIVQIQSMTKTIVAAATRRLIEAGRLGLDSPVEGWLPELADRSVLVDPDADLDQVVPADRSITVSDLLACTSGYGMATSDSPLAAAMRANLTEAGAEPVAVGADEWLAAIAELPLTFQPGRNWRYHHSYAILGILLSRLAGRPLGELLEAEIFAPLGMTDTAFFVPDDKIGRLSAAYRYGDDGALTVTQPAGGGFYAGPPPFDVSHAELVSTAADFARFAAMLCGGGSVGGVRVLSAESVRAMLSDSVDPTAKTPDAFFDPTFWDGQSWAHGGSVTRAGDHPGRYSWAGGQGTCFTLDPGGGYAVLLTQVELGDATWGLIGGLDELLTAASQQHPGPAD